MLPTMSGPGEPALGLAAAADARAAANALMAGVQRGESGAFEELVRRFQKKVYRVVSMYHRNPEDAMEVLQDTFLKVYAARHGWEQRISFTAWLYRIAINASIDRHRRSARSRAESLDALEERSPASSSDPGPLERLRDTERRAVLEGAVRRLPPRQREVVALRFFGDMSLEEIAGALGCPLGTVKSNLHKAVRALKEMLFHQKEALNHD
jgi:RNA polymerase sigma-70 factor (ECF subfamily)